MNENWIRTAREVLEAEAQAIAGAAGLLEPNLAKAVQLILDHRDKLLVGGIGRSSHIGQMLGVLKRSATLTNRLRHF